MKKTIISLVTALICMMGFSYAQNSCLEFTKGTLCFSLENKGNGTYKIAKTFNPSGKSKNMYMLNCRILTPDNKLKELGTCDKTFTYSGNGVKKIRLYIRLEDEKKTLNMEANFVAFSQKQLDTIKNYYKNWSKIKNNLKEKYPNAQDNEKWEDKAQETYDQIKDLYKGVSGKISTYEQFTKLINDFVSFTKNL